MTLTRNRRSLDLRRLRRLRIRTGEVSDAEVRRAVLSCPTHYSGAGLLMGCDVAPAGGSGGVTLIEDLFGDTAGTAIASHTIAPTDTPATSWTNQFGSWQIGGDGASVTDTGVSNFYQSASCDPGQTGVTVSATLVIPVGVHFLFGLVVRLAGQFDYVVAAIEQDGGNAYLAFYRITSNGGNTSLGSATLGADYSNSTHTLQVVCSGANLTLTIDGGNALSTSSAPTTGTPVGLFRYVDATYSSVPIFRDFKVTHP